MVKFEEVKIGWEIAFEVKLTDSESSKINTNPLNHVGDYEIIVDPNIIRFNCIFDAGELKNDEKIEKRLELIKEDIKSLVDSCLK